MLRMSYKDGEYIVSGLTQDHVNAISYSLDLASQEDDTYDVDSHDDLEEFFARIWEEPEDLPEGESGEEGPEEFSGYLTTSSIRDTDEQLTLLDFQEALEKNRASQGDLGSY